MDQSMRYFRDSQKETWTQYVPACSMFFRKLDILFLIKLQSFNKHFSQYFVQSIIEAV